MSQSLRLEKDARTFLLSGQPLARGGEAAIYEIPQQPGLVAKVYHQPTPAHAAKVAAMIAAPPADPMAGRGHVSIAWPVDRLLEAGAPRFLGYVMPWVDKVRPILEFYNPGSRLRLCPLFHYGYLLRTARNLAAAVRALHARGYVIGDLNESNLLVNNMALVTLVDTDSFQVPDARQVHRCPVGKPEYTPPELQGARFADFDRGPEHDAFALAILVFQLLMQGIHPFAGRYTGAGEPPGLNERIAAGHFPYVRGRRVPFAPNPHAPPFDALPVRVQELLRRCFEDGHARSAVRPDAAAWHQALQESEQELAACPANPQQHRYPRHQKSCSWCALARRQGRDLFPSPEDVQAGRVGTPAAPARPPEVLQVPLAPAPLARDLGSRDLPGGVGAGPAAVAAPALRPPDLPPMALPVGASPFATPDLIDDVAELEEAPAPFPRRLLWLGLAGAGSFLLVLGMVLVLVLGGKHPELAKPAGVQGEKSLRNEKASPGKPVPPPPDPNAEALAALRDAIRNKNYIQSAMVGFPLHPPFEEIPPAGGLLIGFEFGLGKFGPNEVVHSVRPIFLTEQGEVLGQVHGTPGHRTVTVKARKGYAVGAVTLNTHLLIDGMLITFMRVEKNALDPKQTYQSESIGSIGGTFGAGPTVGGSGALVLGICGRATPAQCTAFGLVLLGKNRRPSVAVGPEVAGQVEGPGQVVVRSSRRVPAVQRQGSTAGPVGSSTAPSRARKKIGR